MSRARARRGANAVEFGLVFPVLLAIMGGMVDLSWMYTLRVGATSAAQAGARAGAVAPSSTATSVATAAAQSQWSALRLPGTPTIKVTRSGTPQVETVQLQVQAAALMGLVVSSRTLTVTASKAVMPRAP